jgi:uncharacterized damage-inducible protein DinB
MITPSFVRTMSAYNSHMNRDIYAAAGRLTDAARCQDRGAFWGSIQGTLSHLIWADQMWMSRFDGWDHPGTQLKQTGTHVASFDGMPERRFEMDARIGCWADSLSQEWLDQDQSWFSGAVQQTVSRPRTKLLMHMFNHQTHHRGQVHAMITAAGEKTGDTDLWLVV